MHLLPIFALTFLNTVIYSLHCLLVFGAPPLFGWVVLRRVFREASWLAIFPGAIVTGLVALMAVVNEVRYFCEMRIAVWFAYKLLLAVALVVLVAHPRPPPRLRLPGWVNRRWQLLLVVVGALCAGFYYGIPAWSGYLDDAWWGHYPAVVQIQTTERFPLHHMFAIDTPLYYHIGPDILAACWSFLLELSAPGACALNIVLFAPCTFVLAFALLARLSRNYWAALFGASFLIVGGNLRFLLFLTGKYTGLVGALQVFNSQTVQSLLQLMFTPSHMLGVPLVLTILLLFRHVCARPSWRLAGALGLVLGTLTLVAEWYFLPLVSGLTLVGLFQAWRRRPRSLWPSTSSLLLAILPAVIAMFWGALNNTYLSGLFGHYWMHYENIEDVSRTRQIQATLNPGRPTAQNLTIVPSEFLEATPPLMPNLRVRPKCISIGLSGRSPI